jgi:hypothetical protein
LFIQNVMRCVYLMATIFMWKWKFYYAFWCNKFTYRYLNFFAHSFPFMFIFTTSNGFFFASFCASLSINFIWIIAIFSIRHCRFVHIFAFMYPIDIVFYIGKWVRNILWGIVNMNVTSFVVWAGMTLKLHDYVLHKDQN